MQSPVEFSVGELKAALAGFKKIIPGRVTLPVSGCLRFSQTPDKAVLIEAAEPTAFATYISSAAPVGTFEPFLLPMTSLAEVIKTLKSTERISLCAEEGKVRIGYLVGTQFATRTYDTFDMAAWQPQRLYFAPVASRW